MSTRHVCTFRRPDFWQRWQRAPAGKPLAPQRALPCLEPSEHCGHHATRCWRPAALPLPRAPAMRRLCIYVVSVRGRKQRSILATAQAPTGNGAVAHGADVASSEGVSTESKNTQSPKASLILWPFNTRIDSMLAIGFLLLEFNGVQGRGLDREGNNTCRRRYLLGCVRRVRGC